MPPRMNDSTEPPLSTPPEDNPRDASGHLWPSPDYHQQVGRLRAAVGETIYLVELEATAVQLAVRITDRPYTLLGVVDFPRPDPTTGLAPHLVILDDGRGVNLGRIARISIGQAFSPTPAETLFQDRATLQTLLFQERRLSQAQIAQRSKQVLGEYLGGRVATIGTGLPGPPVAIAPPDEA